MSSNVQPSFRPQRSAFVVSGTALSYDANTANDSTLEHILDLFKTWLTGKTKAIRSGRSDRWVRYVLAGEKECTLRFFMHLLGVAFRLGEIKGPGLGRERVRRVISSIGMPFGVDAILTEERATKDLQAETLEAMGAVSEIPKRILQIVRDGVVDANERHEVSGMVKTAQSELSDIVRALPRN